MILVYVADGCPHCQLLIADLLRRRVAFALVNLTQEPERVAELARWTFQRAVPVVVDHERASVGFRGGCTELKALGL
ncbi:MAG: glutaredoxin domain-containing protein [Thermoanaerobaculum sp.]